jgi:hypothetical protein
MFSYIIFFTDKYSQVIVSMFLLSHFTLKFCLKIPNGILHVTALPFEGTICVYAVATQPKDGIPQILPRPRFVVVPQILCKATSTRRGPRRPRLIDRFANGTERGGGGACARREARRAHGDDATGRDGTCEPCSRARARARPRPIHPTPPYPR